MVLPSLDDAEREQAGTHQYGEDDCCNLFGLDEGTAERDKRSPYNLLSDYEEC